MEETKAVASILKILKVLNSRGGFDDWWDNIEDETQEEIIKEMKSKLMEND